MSGFPRPERLGHVALAYPRATLWLLLAVTVALAAAIPRIGINSDLREIYRSDSPEFRTYERITRLFPASETDTYLVLEGDGLLKADSLKRMRELHLDLNFVDGVSHVLSPISARGAMSGDGPPPLLLPLDLEDGPALEAAVERLMKHPLGGQLLVSPDRRAVEFIVSATRPPEDIGTAAALRDAIDEACRRAFADTGITCELAGIQSARVEIVGAVLDDQVMFLAAGLAFSLSIAFAFFRSWRYVTIAAMPVVVAITCLLGAMSLVGHRITPISNMAPTLVLVIALAGTIHLLFRIRGRMAAGMTLESAIGDAVNRVGPACFLSSLTTAVSLLSLTLSGFPFIAGFGYAVAAGALFAFLATMTCVPAGARVLLKGVPSGNGLLDRSLPRLVAVSIGIARRWHVAISVAGIALSLACIVLFFLQQPGFRYSRNLPDDSRTRVAMETIDTHLAGTSAAQLLIGFPSDEPMDLEVAARVSSEAEALFRADKDVRAVVSLGSIVESMSGGDEHQRKRLLGLLESGEVEFAGRILNVEEKAALVTVYFPDVDAQEIVAKTSEWTGYVATLQRRYPQLDMELTGFSLLAANAGGAMISNLKLSLVAAISVILVIIGVWLRSVRLGLLTLPPNVLPIALASAPLYLFTQSMQFSVIIAFTVGFGIAVDDTIHLLNHYREAEARRRYGDSVAAATRRVGVPIVVSSIILVGGMSVTLFSELPMVREFGRLSMSVVTVALIGDLLFLPALLYIGQRLTVPGADNKPPRNHGAGNDIQS